MSKNTVEKVAQEIKALKTVKSVLPKAEYKKAMKKLKAERKTLRKAAGAASSEHIEGSKISGNVTAGGDFTGRDKIVEGDSSFIGGDHVGGDKTKGDKVGGDKTKTGDISDSTVNVKSTPPAADPQQQEMQRLLADLQKELQQWRDTQEGASSELAQEIDAVGKQIDSLTNELNSEDPNWYSLKITAEGLQKAATNIGKTLPLIAPIATSIVQIASAYGK